MGRHDRQQRPTAPDPASVTEQQAPPAPEPDFYVQIGHQGPARILAQQHGLHGVGVVIEGLGAYFVTGGHLNKKTGEIE